VLVLPSEPRGTRNSVDAGTDLTAAPAEFWVLRTRARPSELAPQELRITSWRQPRGMELQQPTPVAHATRIDPPIKLGKGEASDS
jgi:hypothetical protein